MKKALLALTIAAISGTAMAQLPDFLGKGEYTVRTDISKQTLKNADLKEKHKVQKNIGFRAICRLTIFTTACVSKYHTAETKKTCTL